MFTGKKHLSFYSTKTYNVKALVLLVLLVNLTNAIYHPGVVSSACMRCICKQESSCRPLDCKIDSGSLSCGYFQIKRPITKTVADPVKTGQPAPRILNVLRSVFRTTCVDTVAPRVHVKTTPESIMAAREGIDGDTLLRIGIDLQGVMGAL
ncbi:hypothetical protein ScPMuIL_016697 [Solemya velum]